MDILIPQEKLKELLLKMGFYCSLCSLDNSCCYCKNGSEFILSEGSWQTLLEDLLKYN